MKPYKGLEPYEEKDRGNFFGREAEKRILVDKILTNKLTLLFAASGVGKSSLLRAAVLPDLKRADGENLDVVYCRDWVEEPLRTLKREIYRELLAAGKLDPEHEMDFGMPLKAFLHVCTLFSSEPLVLMLDQFEEFFNYQRFTPHFAPFIRELTAAILDHGTATAFVFSMREDFALELNAFKPDLPTILFSNYYRLEKLSLARAKEAIALPLVPAGFEYEAGLLDTLLEDLSRREQIERFGETSAALMDAPLMVEPPHLQIVCTQLWDLDCHNPARQITRRTYEAQDKAGGLLRSYFYRQVANFSAHEKKLASLGFNYLVNKHGTKMAYPLPDLAKLIVVEEEQLGKVLDKLEHARILRRQARKGVMWYELYHDIFSKSIYDWNEAYKARQRNKRAALASLSVFVSASLLYAAYDIWVNATEVHVRLSVKSSLSREIELYQGKTDSTDLLTQQRYLMETGYERDDLEADQLFQEAPVLEAEHLDTEIIRRFPRLERITSYWESGRLDKAFTLARYGVLSKNRRTAEDVIRLLAGFKSVQALQKLSEYLEQAQDPSLKQTIVNALTATDAPPELLFSLLQPAFGDPHKDVQIRALSALSAVPTPEAKALLLARLEDPRAEIRTHAADVLATLKQPHIADALAPLLHDPDASVRLSALSTLGNLNAKGFSEQIAALVKDSNPVVRTRVCYVLVQLDTPEYALRLVPLLTDSETDDEFTGETVSTFAARALLHFGVIETIPAIVELLNNGDESVRETVLPLLIHFKHREAVIAQLIPLLNHPDEAIRGSVTDSLAELGSAAAIPSLRQRLSEPDPEIRSKAVYRLSKLGGAEALPYLEPLLDDPHPAVAQAVIAGLSRFDIRQTLPVLLRGLASLDGTVRADALKALQSSGIDDSRVIAAVVPLLQDPHWLAKENAAKFLSSLNPMPAAVQESLLTALQDPKLRSITGHALDNAPRPAMVAPLFRLLEDARQDVATRSEVMNILVGWTETGIVPPGQLLSAIGEQLKSDEPYLRQSAQLSLVDLFSLSEQAQSAVEQILFELLRDEKLTTQESATIVLFKLDIPRGTDLISEEVLRNLLKSKDIPIRTVAAVRLVERFPEDKQAQKALIDALDSFYKDIRVLAALTLGKAGATAAINPLKKRLRDFYPEVADVAISALATIIGPQGVTDFLHEALDDSQLMSYALRALSANVQFANQETLRLLIKGAENYDARLLPEIQSTLLKIVRTHRLEPLLHDELVELLASHAINARTMAATLLGIMQKAPAALPEALSDQYASVQLAASRALNASGRTLSIPSLLSLLRDENYETRFSVISVLTELETAGCIKEIISASREDEEIASDLIQNSYGFYEQPFTNPYYYEGYSEINFLKMAPSEVKNRFIGEYFIPEYIEEFTYSNYSEYFSELTGTQLDAEMLRLLDSMMRVYWENQLGLMIVAALHQGGRYEFLEQRRALILKLLKTETSEYGPSFRHWSFHDDLVTALIDLNFGNDLSAQEISKYQYHLLQLDFYLAKITSRSHDMFGYSSSSQDTDEFTFLSEFDEAAPVIIHLLSDKNSKIRKNAADALGAMREEKAVGPLTALLGDPESKVRASAAEALGKIGETEALQALLQLLQNPNEPSRVRLEAVKALGELDDRRALPALTAALRDSDGPVRAEAIEALQSIGYERQAVPRLAALLKDEEADIRSAAAITLGLWGVDEVEGTLAALLDDENPQVRGNAVAALTTLGSTHALKPVIEALRMELLEEQSETQEYQENSAASFSKLGVTKPSIDKDTQELLDNSAEILTAPDVASRDLRDAAKDLGYHPVPEAVALLGKLLEKPDSSVRVQTLIALKRLTRIRPELIRPLHGQLKSLADNTADTDTRRLAEQVLFNLSPERAYLTPEEQLLRFARDRQAFLYTRNTSIQLLGKLGKAEYVPALIEIFEAETTPQADNPLAFFVYQALGNLDSRQALPFLNQQLKTLEKRKRQWRKKRDKSTEDLIDFDPDDPAYAFQEEDRSKAWQETYLEAELAYAITKIDPLDSGFELLRHNLASVREAAWFGIARQADGNTIERLVEIHRSLSAEKPLIRHAFYRAIHRSLEQLEFIGTQDDLDMLTGLTASIDRKTAVYDRLDWTTRRLKYRLEVGDEEIRRRRMMLEGDVTGGIR